MVTQSVVSEPETQPRGGRPRDPRLDVRILETATDLFQKHGYEGVSMEAVARAACVSKPTIYRRWTSKDELLLDALAAIQPSFSVEVTGDARVDLTTFLTKMYAWGGPGDWSLLARLMQAVPQNPHLAAAFRERVVAPRRAALAAFFAEAIARGALNAPAPIDTLIDLVLGPPMTACIMNLVTGQPDPEPAAAARCLADAIWEGFGPTKQVRRSTTRTATTTARR